MRIKYVQVNKLERWLKLQLRIFSDFMYCTNLMLIPAHSIKCTCKYNSS